MIQDNQNSSPSGTAASASVATNPAADDSRMAFIEAELSTLHTELQALKEQLAELLEFIGAMKGALKMLTALGKLAKPVGYIVGACTAAVGLWAALKGPKP